jgi:hypothetical protein
MWFCCQAKNNTHAEFVTPEATHMGTRQLQELYRSENMLFSIKPVINFNMTNIFVLHTVFNKCFVTSILLSQLLR